MASLRTKTIPIAYSLFSYSLLPIPYSLTPLHPFPGDCV